MSKEVPFSFESHYPGHKYWRGGPEKLDEYKEELIVYGEGLLKLATHLNKTPYSTIVTLGYSAPNMINDIKSVADESRLPPHVSITGDDSWKLYYVSKSVAQKTYFNLQIPFDGGVLVDDFAEYAVKAKGLE
jgi:hypothetical protein